MKSSVSILIPIVGSKAIHETIDSIIREVTRKIMIKINEDEIMNKWNKKYGGKVQVSITCLAYNHEKFIEDCLDSLLSQNVDFPYEIIVHDDASTDKTADIIKEYELRFPMIIKPIYEKENQYSKKDGTLNRIVNNKVSGKYRAICECDDFWIDNSKLQRQFDYLENHSECVACCSGGIIVDQNGKATGEKFNTFRDNQILSIYEVVSQWIAPTASIIFRFSLNDKLVFSQLKNIPCGDYPLLCGLALLGNVFYEAKETCAYRNNPNSVTHNKSIHDFYIRKKQLLLMLREMNALTNSKYESGFSKMADTQIINYYMATSNVKLLKKDFHLFYNTLNPKTKIHLWIKYFINRNSIQKEGSFENFKWKEQIRNEQ